MKDTNLQEVDQFAAKLLNLRWLSKMHLSQELSDYQITPSQYITLCALEHSPHGVKMSDLAKHAHHVSATMTGIVDRLESQNLVSRFRQPEDRRSVFVQLTSQGEELLLAISSSKKAKLKEILDQLSAEQKTLLYSVIDIAAGYFNTNLRGNE